TTMDPSPNARTKKRFVLLTLLIWLLFVLVAIPQWMIMCLYAENPLVFTVIFFIIGFIMLGCIHLSETLKYKRPWNIICVLICYEILTIGVALFLTMWNLIYTLILIAAGIILSGIALLLSWLSLIWGAYGNPTKIAIVGCMGFILVYCIRSVDIFNKFFFLRDIEVLIFMISVFTIMVCHILITYDNFDLLRRDDPMHVAFVLHMCFMMLLIGGRVSAVCVMANIDYFDGKVPTTVTPSIHGK
ncbi:hypothetical protein KR032_001227, partial [Drosophila birchii]